MRCQAGVTAEDARRVGAELARVHVAGEGIAVGEGRFRVEDLRARLQTIAGASDPELAAQAPVLTAKLETWTARRARGVGEGLIHGDLFRDNVLWNADGSIAALLDFESASRGRFAFDLMVTVLAWAFGEGLDAGIARALSDGYRSVRELGEDERAALLAEGCVAALRFTTTRITDYAMRGEGVGPRVMKDWRRFTMRLRTLEELGEAGGSSAGRECWRSCSRGAQPRTTRSAAASRVVLHLSDHSTDRDAVRLPGRLDRLPADMHRLRGPGELERDVQVGLADDDEPGRHEEREPRLLDGDDAGARERAPPSCRSRSTE